MIVNAQQPTGWQRARSLILRWLISSLAIFAAVYLVPGIHFVGPGWQIGAIALVFGLINILLRPLLTVLTCPLIILTLGLFGLVINAVLLTLTAAVASRLGFQFTVDGFWPAFFGGLVISLVTLILNTLAQTEDRSLRVHVQYKRKDEDKEP
jgi:putative membrane protein